MLRKFISTGFAALLSTAYKYDRDNEKKSVNNQSTLAINTHYKLTILKNRNIKPTIVALYEKNDGSKNADLAIHHFENKGMEVVRISSETGLNHPIFKSGAKINGIYLPGGSDVPVNNPHDPRKKFEDQLIKLGKENDIPVLGICRGEQTIGNHYGLEIKDLPENDEHYSHEAEICSESGMNNKVMVEKGSELHKALRRKLNPDENNPIEYSVICLHHQHIVDKKNNENTEIKVSARNPFDNTIDSIEIQTGNYFTIGFQHHPEVVINHFEKTRENTIKNIQEEIDEALMTPHHFSDNEFTLFKLQKATHKIAEARTKSIHEKAARAELGLFIHQARKKFAETAVTAGHIKPNSRMK